MRLAVATFVFGMSLARPVAALECVVVGIAGRPGLELEAAIHRAEIVLLGRIDVVRFEMGDADLKPHYVLTITVKQLWKGETPSVLTLYQRPLGGSIDFAANVGKEYVLFLHTMTPERWPSMTRGKPVLAGLEPDECLSKPAEKFDLKLLGASVPPKGSAALESVDSLVPSVDVMRLL